MAIPVQDNLRNFPWKPPSRSNQIAFSHWNHAMDNLGLCLLVQLCLVFGVAGLFWPDKFIPLFDVLMFPWAASYRVIRAHSIAAIGVSLLLLVTLLKGSV
jgi:hypothetical protein